MGTRRRVQSAVGSACAGLHPVAPSSCRGGTGRRRPRIRGRSWTSLTRSTSASASRIGFSVYPPEGTKFPRGAVEMAISPDGTRLVFVVLSRDGQRSLWMRRFDATESRSIPGTEDAHAPFWSPDGRSIGFFTHGGLRRIAETGGISQHLCNVRFGGRGGTWSQHGIILFGGAGQPVMQVADTGGVPKAVTRSRPERGGIIAGRVFLPDGRRFLYFAQGHDPAATAIYEGSLNYAGTCCVMAAEAPVGVTRTHLLTFSKGLLSAQPYAAQRAQLEGEPITVASRVASDPPSCLGAAFAVANDVVAFRSASPDSRLAWFDRNGVELGAFPVSADYHHPWLSPDEKRVAIEKTDPSTGRHTIWILDLSRGTSSRVLLDTAGAHQPLWSAHGRQMIFSSNRLGGIDLYEIDPEKGGEGSLLLSSDENGMIPTDWSRDGRYLFVPDNGREKADVFVLPLSAPRSPKPYLQTSASEIQARFSPDVRWVAYASNESGSHEVYVRAFPDTGGRWADSTRGGAQPQWRGDGKELFYLGLDGKMMAATIVAGPAGIGATEPRELFNVGIVGPLLERRNRYAVTRDGLRFRVNLSAEDESSAPITVSVNWKPARNP